MAENRTKPASQSVSDFLESLENKARRDDSLELIERMAAITGCEPRLWGSSMVGFGSWHYRYASGREGDMFLVGFSPRKQALVLYLVNNLDELEPDLGALGNFKRGVGCLYLKRLADADPAQLKALILKAMKLNQAADTQGGSH